MEEEKNEQELEKIETISEQNLQENNLEQKQKEQEVKKEYKPFEPLKQESPKKKRKNGKIIAFLIVIVLFIGVIGYYYYSEFYTNPQTIYKTVITNSLNSLIGTEEEITTVKSKVKLDVNLDLEDKIEENIEDIIDLINDIELELEVQIDNEKQQLLYKLDTDYEDEELFKVNALIDAKKEKLYMQLEQFFEDTLEIEVEDDEAFEEIREAFEVEQLTIGEEISRAKAIKILNKEISNIIKEEYCSKEQEKITVDSKEINTDKYVLKMTSTQLVDEIKVVAENLKNSEEYLKCFEEKEETKQQLEDLITELEDIETDDNATISIKIYRKGIQQQTVRIEIELEDEEGKYILRVDNTGKIYKFRAIKNEKTYLSGEIEAKAIDFNNGKLNIKLDIEQIGRIELNINAGYITGKEIDTIETENAINIEEITEEDAIDAYKKLEDSKLYKLIQKYSNNFIQSEDTKDDDKLSGTEELDVVTTKENEILSYQGQKVTYQIPNGFNLDYNSDTLKGFNKGDTNISISTSYSDKSEYFQLVNNYKKICEKDPYYENVQMSQQKTIKVNGKTFYYVELSYEYYEQTYYEIYICTEINTTEVYTIEFSTDEYTTLDEFGIEKFLTIEY